jgi:bifunctional DNA-binding transcriptional regulator/antitoxin component of YhaV-PrlF toxin-antitoxin module
VVCCNHMGSSVSTVTSKFQVTLPEEVRKQFQVDIGEKILWEVRGDVLVGKRLPSLMDLAGCLKSNKPPATDQDISRAWGTAAVAREKRIKNQK